MSTLSTAGRNAAVNAVTALINVSAPGHLVFQTSGGTPVATLAFSSTSFGAGSTGVATANAISSDTNAAGGTTTKAVLNDGAGTTVLTVTVGTSGSDINLSSTTIGAGDTVSVSSLTLTMPA